MSKIRLKVALVLALAMIAAACASGGDDEQAAVRNITLPSTTSPTQGLVDATWRDVNLASEVVPEWSAVSRDDGTALVTVSEALTLANLKNSPLHSGEKIPDSITALTEEFGDLRLRPEPVRPDVRLLATIDRITKVATAVPVIVRLPVPFDPIAVGTSLRAGTVKGDDSVWKKLPIERGTNDPAIARATVALYTALSSSRSFTAGTFDRGLVASAVASVDDPTVKPARDGVKMSASQVFAQLGVVPFVRIMTTRAQLLGLFERGLIAGVEIDRHMSPTLDDSTDLIRSADYHGPMFDRRWTPSTPSALDGTGVTIAVLDGGVDTSHAAFAGRLVDEACFVECGPTGTDSSSTEAGSGAPCDLSVTERCDHGTHVAGIALGAAADGAPDGVALNANLITHRVCRAMTSRLGCPVSAQVASLGRVATLTSTYDIAAVNISLGNPDLSQPSCPTGPWNSAFDAAVLVLRAADVLTVKAQGNRGSVEHADCVHPVVMFVANSTKTDGVNPSTDFHRDLTDLWAPGTDISAASTHSTGPNVEAKSGTSMAAPHVAGALALIRHGVRLWNGQASAGNALPLYGSYVRRMLGADPTDPARVLIADDRTGGSEVERPRLSLHRLVELAAGPRATGIPQRLSDTEIAAVEQAEAEARAAAEEQARLERDRAIEEARRSEAERQRLEAERQRAELAAQLARLRPDRWQVNDQVTVRRTLPVLAFPMGRKLFPDINSNRETFRATLWSTEVRPDDLPPAEALVETPRLVMVTSNNTSLSVADASGRELDAVPISRGPSPCEGDLAGWTEVWEVELTDDVLGQLPLYVELEGVVPKAEFYVQWFVGEGDYAWVGAAGNLDRNWAAGTTIVDRTPIVLDERNGFSGPRIGDASVPGSTFWMGALIDREVQGALRPDTDRTDYLGGRGAADYGPVDRSWQSYGASMVAPLSDRFGSVNWNRVVGVHDCRVVVETYWVATD